MLWKSRTSKAAPPGDPGTTNVAPVAVPEVAKPTAEELSHALDTVGSMLRTYGKTGFDLPDQSAADLQITCEKWAQHLLVWGARPSDDEGTSRGAKVRDWVGAAQFFAQSRRTESAFLGKTLNDLRHAVWAFVHGLHQALSEDTGSDAQVRAQLSRLKEAAQGNSTEDLRREAVSVVVTIGQVMEGRRQKQQSMTMELGARVASLGQQLEEARRESSTDPLTQLYNRRAFDDQIMKSVSLCSMTDQPVCLVMVDIDHFKRINDTYGHPIGDEVLRKLSECLVRTFLRRDDFVARYGGEEFAIVLRDTRLADSVMVTERLMKAARQLDFSHGGQAFKITISAGVAGLEEGQTGTSWIERADEALYRAKHGGRDRICQAEVRVEI